MALEIENRGGAWREVKLCYQVDWMMGARGAEARLAHEFARDGQCFASSPEGYAAMTTILDLAADAGPNGRLSAALALEPGKTRLISLLMAAGAVKKPAGGVGAMEAGAGRIASAQAGARGLERKAGQAQPSRPPIRT